MQGPGGCPAEATAETKQVCKAIFEEVILYLDLKSSTSCKYPLAAGNAAGEKTPNPCHSCEYAYKQLWPQHTEVADGLVQSFRTLVEKMNDFWRTRTVRQMPPEMFKKVCEGQFPVKEHFSAYYEPDMS